MPVTACFPATRAAFAQGSFVACGCIRTGHNAIGLFLADAIGAPPSPSSDARISCRHPDIIQNDALGLGIVATNVNLMPIDPEHTDKFDLGISQFSLG